MTFTEETYDHLLTMKKMDWSNNKYWTKYQRGMKYTGFIFLWRQAWSFGLTFRRAMGCIRKRQGHIRGLGVCWIISSNIFFFLHHLGGHFNIHQSCGHEYKVK